MKSHYLSLILAYTCLLPTTVYLYGCASQSPIEQKSNSESQQVTPQPELSGLAAQIYAIAEAITVRIDTPNGNGSGVIIAKDGENYYLLTAEHVVAKEQEYNVVTPDGQQYFLEYSQVNKISGADLAVVQFTSQENYQVATLANYKSKQQEMLEELSKALGQPGNTEANISRIGQKYGQIFQEIQYLFPWIFLFGWQRTQNIPQPRLTAGRDSTSRKTSLLEEDQATTVFKEINIAIQEKGYRLSYTNFSQGGMSGGAVLDTQGRVIGIHAAAEGERVGLKEIQLGFSLGIPIKTFISSAKQAGIQPEWLTVETSLPSLITSEDEKVITESLLEVKLPNANARATDWINYGNKRWRSLSFEEAIAAFDQAIILKSNLPQAHYGRGMSLRDQEDIEKSLLPEEDEESLEIDRVTYEKALAAFVKTTELDPDFELAWREQGILLMELERYPEALTAFDQAIALNPINDSYHSWRGSVLEKLDRPAEAIEAYTKAISIKPDISYYMSRSLIFMVMGNFQKAKADIERAREIDPEFVDKIPFSNRW